MHHSRCIDGEGEGKVATFAGEVPRVKEVMEWGAGGLRRKEQKETYERMRSMQRSSRLTSAWRIPKPRWPPFSSVKS